VGAYGLLDSSTPHQLGLPVLGAGALTAAGGTLLAGRRVRRSRYRPDRWRPAELAVAGCGIVAAGLFQLTTGVDPVHLYPSLAPLTWPELAPLPAVALGVALLPAWLSPPAPNGSPSTRLATKGSQP
ncbi:MAG: energy-coupling factor transporter transmembrane protein EcfT, partial [Dactylosporangium sp.]|nr:energy-coupling factor transporter transmembrane protein EcfT [Dactylosporangium sp.]NNJ60906.1 energy-coupling factor transporter transmembrane protein EcfT [Dactylosporangium sp.]